MGLGRLLLAGVMAADVPSTLSRLREVSHRPPRHYAAGWANWESPIVWRPDGAWGEPLQYLLALVLGTLVDSVLC